MWAHRHCFGSHRLRSVVVVVVVVVDDGDDDAVGFGSRWGLGGKGEKMGFGDVEKKGGEVLRTCLKRFRFLVLHIHLSLFVFF